LDLYNPNKQGNKMTLDKYNHYARWYEKERKLAAIAIYSGDTIKIKESEETLQFIKDKMTEEYNKTIGEGNVVMS
jgi:hypothetical protein